jgi:hypothetical protein
MIPAQAGERTQALPFTFSHPSLEPQVLLALLVSLFKTSQVKIRQVKNIARIFFLKKKATYFFVIGENFF